jgi:hypothetical protein
VFPDHESILKASTCYKPINKELNDNLYTSQLKKHERNFMDLIQITLDEAGEIYLESIHSQLDKLFCQNEKEIHVESKKIAQYIKFIANQFNIKLDSLIV